MSPINAMKASFTKCLFAQSQIAVQSDNITSLKGEPIPTITTHSFNHTVTILFSNQPYVFNVFVFFVTRY